LASGILRIVALVVFGGCGVVISRWFRQPRAVMTWVALVVALVAASCVGTHAALLSVFGAAVYLNWVLQSLVLGIAVGLLIRMAKAGKLTKKTA
jgi:hypothetical protein